MLASSLNLRILTLRLLAALVLLISNQKVSSRRCEVTPFSFFIEFRSKNKNKCFNVGVKSPVMSCPKESKTWKPPTRKIVDLTSFLLIFWVVISKGICSNFSAKDKLLRVFVSGSFFTCCLFFLQWSINNIKINMVIPVKYPHLSDLFSILEVLVGIKGGNANL